MLDPATTTFEAQISLLAAVLDCNEALVVRRPEYPEHCVEVDVALAYHAMADGAPFAVSGVNAADLGYDSAKQPDSVASDDHWLRSVVIDHYRCWFQQFVKAKKNLGRGRKICQVPHPVAVVVLET